MTIGILAIGYTGGGSSPDEITIHRKADGKIEVKTGDGANQAPILDASALLALAVQRTRFKLGTFTRAMDAASGAVAITGVGFTPRLVIFFGGKQDSAIFTLFGVDDGTKAYHIHDDRPAAVQGFGTSNTKSIGLYETGAYSQVGAISALGADGFTITWTKAGTPAAATVDMFYIAIA